jgi:hypothetical protein
VSAILVEWFCPMCKETVEKNLKADRQIEEKCRLFLKTVEDRLKMLEVRADNFVTRDEVQDIINNTWFSEKVYIFPQSVYRPLNFSQLSLYTLDKTI